MTIGERIRLFRKSKKLSGDKLAELCDLSKGAISLWEKNEVVPPIERLLAINKHYSDLSLDWIYLGKATEANRTTICAETEAPPYHTPKPLSLETKALAELEELDPEKAAVIKSGIIHALNEARYNKKLKDEESKRRRDDKPGDSSHLRRGAL